MPVRNTIIAVFQSSLPDPAQSPLFARARFDPASRVELSDARTRQKAQAGVERFAKVIQGGKTIQEIVGIVDDVTPTVPVPAKPVASAESGPAGHLKILRAGEFRSTPGAVKSDERVAVNAVRVSVCEDRPDAKFWCEVVGDTPGEEIRPGHDGCDGW